MAFLLPIWTVASRPLLGAGLGWELLHVVFFFVPATFVLLMLYFLMLRMRNKKAKSRSIGDIDSLLLLGLYLLILLYPLFLISQPDNPDQYNSLASLHLGIGVELSDTLANMLYGLAIALLAVCFVVFAYELKAKKLLGTEKARKHKESDEE